MSTKPNTATTDSPVAIQASPTEDFIAAVEEATGKSGRTRGSQTSLHCPAHNDRQPSLSVAAGDDGRVLAKCHAGCSFTEVCEAIDRKPSEFGPPNEEGEWTPAGPAVAIYSYTDESGELLFQVCRTADKQFRQRRPDENSKSGWSWSLTGVRRVLYRLPEVFVAIDNGEIIYVCEGEKDADALRDLGVSATCNPGGAGNWRKDYTEALAGAEVVVIADTDAPGRRHAAEVGEALLGVAASVLVLEPASGKDVSDHLAAGLALQKLVPLTRDAGTDPIPPESLEPVDGLQLLEDIAALIRRHVVVSDAQLDTLVLWVVHTHAVDAASRTPYLHIHSATPRCGKSRLFEVLELLVREAWLVDSVTAAVLARRIDAIQPTLLFDEVDQTFKGNEEARTQLTAILNGGIRRGAKKSLLIRKGGDWVAQDLNTFCPKALAGIGTLPATITDRCIPIELKRKLEAEEVERFYHDEAAALAAPIHEAARAWAAQNALALTAARPDSIAELHDRADEAWWALLAIADEVGGDWPERARDAAIALCGGMTDAQDDEYGIRLLGDIREQFEDRQVDRLPTRHLLSGLVNEPESAWTSWWDEFKRELTKSSPQALARMLTPFGIRSRSIRLDDGSTPKGYLREQFEEAWARYLPDIAVEPPQTPHSADDTERAADADPPHELLEAPQQALVAAAGQDGVPGVDTVVAPVAAASGDDVTDVPGQRPAGRRFAKTSDPVAPETDLTDGAEDQVSLEDELDRPPGNPGPEECVTHAPAASTVVVSDAAGDAIAETPRRFPPLTRELMVEGARA